MKLEEQVDMVELKEFREIDLDETPVVALACRHFFTAETLDGLIGLNTVYEIDPATGNTLGLKDISSELAPAIPRCPHCQRPIRQHVTQRYNRLINRAVIDEMSKRFIVTGQTELQGIKTKLIALEAELAKASVGGNKTRNIDGRPKALKESKLTAKLKARYTQPAYLRAEIVDFRNRVNKRHQPAHKLHEAILHVTRRNASLEDVLNGFTFQQTTTPGDSNQRIKLEASLMELKLECIVLEDKHRFLKSEASGNDEAAVASLELLPVPFKLFIESCAGFFEHCKDNHLPRIAVEASLCYSRVAYLFTRLGNTDPKDREMASSFHEQAKTILATAADLCEQKFQDAERLSTAVDEAIKLFRKEWYEPVSKEELAAIKNAMLSGPEGIATHSGHWYNCVNGHPFAIGECGMPMELARCPECGEPIGGQSHEAVDGVTRARNME
ncbi:hypothetical protein Q7P37_011465 [Cladosporium fusiforme]